MKREIKYDGLPESDAFKPIKAPKLIGGTEHEIKEATKNRNEICRDLAAYAVKFTSDGRPSTLYQIARQGMDAIMQDIQNNPAVVDAEDDNVRSRRIARECAAYRDLAQRIARYNKIVSNDHAEYWLNKIDPVTRVLDGNTEKTKRFKRKIDGKL